MGNCCGNQSSSMVWAGEDRKPLIKEEKKMTGSGDNKQMLIASSSFSSTTSGSGGTKREMKLKISKKELASLMELVDIHGLSLEQVLWELIDGDDHQIMAEWKCRRRTTSWRPVLQSIPEND